MSNQMSIFFCLPSYFPEFVSCNDFRFVTVAITITIIMPGP